MDTRRAVADNAAALLMRPTRKDRMQQIKINFWLEIEFSRI
jgi:hypothetical protein